jgi:phosphohistidine phosphatase
VKAVFFRHGPAVPHGSPGIAEAERPLSPEGRKKTLLAAQGLRTLELGISAIFTSPLPRALQTAEILAEILGLSRPKLLDALLPNVPAKQLLSELRGLRTDTLLLVGHEPQLSAAVSLAVCGSVKGSIELKKAGLAFVEFHRISPRPEGTLLLLLGPGAQRRLGRTSS